MRNRFKLVCMTGWLALGLSACNGKGESVQEMMGMTRNGPDAFNVVSRPPLSVPPEFALRPPAPVGTPGPGEPRMDDVARGLLTGEEASNLAVETAVMGVGSNGLETVGERNLMDRFGASQADPLIREQLTTDMYTRTEEDSEGWLDSMIPALREEKAKDTLDPVEEARKLREDDNLKDALQAPPETFLKKAEEKDKKSPPSRDAMAKDIWPEEGNTVKDLRKQVPTDADAK